MSAVALSRSLAGRLLGEKTVSLLANTDFRTLYVARLVSRVGDKLYFVAAMWLVYQLTGSTFYTGLAGFLSRAPQAVGFLFGPLVDRADLERLLVAGEAAQALVVLAVPVAAALGHLHVAIVLGVVTVLSVFQRITAPGQQAALPRIVSADLLPRANSLDSATNKGLGATAEAVAGTLIAVVGGVAMFAVNAATFAVSTVILTLLSVPETDATGTSPSPREYLGDLTTGLDVVRGSVVGHMVVAASLAGLFTGMATAVLPAFADGIGGPGAYGLLVGAATAGTLVGSLLASRLESVGFGRVVAGGFLLAAAGRVAAVAVDWPPAVLAFYGAAAVPVGVYNVLVSAVIQTGVPNDLLARVSSTTGSLVAVVAPLGLLAGGWLGGVLDGGTVIGLSAVGYLGLAAYWLAVPRLRRFPPVTGVDSGAFGLDGDAA